MGEMVLYWPSGGGEDIGFSQVYLGKGVTSLEYYFWGMQYSSPVRESDPGIPRTTYTRKGKV